MKRRMIALALLLALLLSGCGADADSPAQTAAPAAPTAAPSPVPAAEERPAPSTPSGHSGERFPYDYSEQLADTEDFSLSVTALGVDADDNWVVHLRLENRSGEIMSFRFLYQSINGLAIDDTLTYRVGIGGTLEPSFRILRGEMAVWGFEKPVQWSFMLRVSSAEDPDRAPFFFEELSASPFGEKNAVRYEYVPGPSDHVVMDNDYAVVYLTGWKPEDGGLSIEYVAVSRCDRPLTLVLPEGEVLLDGRAYPVELQDSFGAFATLMGYIPVPGWTGEEPPASVEMSLALADPAEWGDPLIEDASDAEDIYVDNEDIVVEDEDIIPVR